MQSQVYNLLRFFLIDLFLRVCFQRDGGYRRSSVFNENDVLKKSPTSEEEK